MNNPWILLNNQVLNREENTIDLEKDKEAARQFFLEYVNKNTVYFGTLQEKLNYLINDKYYFNVFDHYSYADIKKVFEFVYKVKFRFGSYMAAFLFYKNYAMKDVSDDKFLERYEDRIAMVALYTSINVSKDKKLMKGDVKKALKQADIMISQEYQPATPTFANSGKLMSGELISCFLDEIGDSKVGIAKAIQASLDLSSMGGGVALNISKLRGRGEAIKGVSGRASGVLPVMKLLEDTFSYANQLGQRPGAGAVYLNIFHSDIEEFLDCKKINADEKLRIKSLSIGVILSNKFFELAKNDVAFFTFQPYTVFKEYGKHLDDMDIDVMYDELVNNPNVKKKKLNARKMLTKLAQIQKESGYPYIFFKDNANKYHPIKNIGDVKFSNLCTEIFQVSNVSEYNDYDNQNNDEINHGISCNLGSLNIANVMKNSKANKGRFEYIINTAVDSLTFVTDVTNIGAVPSIAKGNRDFHSIGLGAMNLHGYLAQNEIMYESTEALDFANVFFSMMNFYTLKRSMEIAKDKKETFYGFKESEYGTGKYFDRYEDMNMTPITDDVKTLFEGIDIPTKEDWKQLKSDVMEFGVYHAYRQAIAPNQSTAYIMSATPSIMPISDQVEVREYDHSTTFYPMAGLNNDNMFFYKSAYDMDQFKVLKLMSVVQRHIDQGISCILHTNSSDDTALLARYYIYAHEMGLKSLYYTRTRKSSIDDCISCSA